MLVHQTSLQPIQGKLSFQANLNASKKNLDFQILDSNQGPQACGANNSDCDFGYLTHRLGSLIIAGARKLRSISRALHTDANIPLSGHNTVIGRSLVIYADFGPVARGERLACSM